MLIPKSSLSLTALLVFVSLYSRFLLLSINSVTNTLTQLETGIKTDTKGGIQVYKALLEPVPNPFKKTGRAESKTVPLLFVEVGGDLNQMKISLANRAICDWQIRLKKKKKPKEGECPFYQPSTQSMELRSFFGHMSRQYHWQITAKSLTGFDGALCHVMGEVYSQREEIWVSDTIFNI